MLQASDAIGVSHHSEWLSATAFQCPSKQDDSDSEGEIAESLMQPASVAAAGQSSHPDSLQLSLSPPQPMTQHMRASPAAYHAAAGMKGNSSQAVNATLPTKASAATASGGFQCSMQRSMQPMKTGRAMASPAPKTMAALSADLGWMSLPDTAQRIPGSLAVSRGAREGISGLWGTSGVTPSNRSRADTPARLALGRPQGKPSATANSSAHLSFPMIPWAEHDGCHVCSC